jgi:hypothetical protein
LCNCASNYHLLKPELVDYTSNTSINDGIEISYKYNALNKKYRKKAHSKDIRIVSIKIKNTTSKAIQLGKDFNLVSSLNNNLQILPSEEAYRSLKQKSGSYLFYLFLSPLQLYRTETNQYGQTYQESIFPIGLILGPAISLSSFITASKANKKFKKELAQYDISDTVINPQQEVFSLIAIRSSEYPNITAQIIQ